MVKVSGFAVAFTLALALGIGATAPAFAQNAAKNAEKEIRADLKSRKGSDFAPLLSRWEKRFGSNAVETLMKIAGDRKLEDSDRYIALMAGARLGGSATAETIATFLKDRAWMMRSAALRTLAAFDAKDLGAQTLPLLKDPALVVRMEAVDTVKKLQPEGSVEALLEVVASDENYFHGKAQWVPQRALVALMEMKASRSIAPKLAPLLKRESDPDLQKTAISTLESILGKQLKPGAPLPERIRAWDTELKTLSRPSQSRTRVG